MSVGERREQVGCLAWFQCDEALDLVAEFSASPVVDSFGRTAAACGLDWTRAAAWLDSGRPLSLVVLDALYAFVRYDTRLLRVLQPRLSGVTDTAIIAEKLEKYRESDPVPRVKRMTALLLENVDQLVAVE